MLDYITLLIHKLFYVRVYLQILGCNIYMYDMPVHFMNLICKNVLICYYWCCIMLITDMIIGELVIFSKKVLGQGAFGTVFEGQWKHQPCAAKMLSILGNAVYTGVSVTKEGAVQEEVLARFKQECDFMKTLLHSNIVAYYDTLIHPSLNLPVLVMELMDTSLHQYIKNMEDMSLEVQFQFSTDIAAALDFLHSRGLVHRDLCGDNILLKYNSETKPVAKISDFGLSRLILNHPELTHSLSALGHRPGYLPPEAPEYPIEYDSSLDIFMFGAVMTQIASKMPTIKSKDERQRLVCNLDRANHPLTQIVSKCLEERREDRPTASTLCAILQDVKSASTSTCTESSSSASAENISQKMQKLCLDSPIKCGKILLLNNLKLAS